MNELMIDKMNKEREENHRPMIAKFTQPPQGVPFHQKAILSYLKANETRDWMDCLDVGPRSPLTNAIERAMWWDVTNTVGDLDEDFVPENYSPPNYNVITYSHTIEHQFNPLFTLLELKKYLAPGGRIYVSLPQRGKLLWVDHHFHEIDDTRIRLLFERAGLRVLDRNATILGPRPWHHYIRGFRAMARLFFEKNAIYKLEVA